MFFLKRIHMNTLKISYSTALKQNQIDVIYSRISLKLHP